MWHKLESFLERLKLEFDAAAGAREDAGAEMKKRGEERELGERERAGFDVGVEADELWQIQRPAYRGKKRGGLLVVHLSYIKENWPLLSIYKLP